MVRDLLHPQDDAGVPRHFGSHLEAFLWVAGSLARYGPRLLSAYAYAAVGWLAWNIGETVFVGAPLDLFPPQSVWLVFAAVSFPVLFWVLGTILVYVYLVLSGVVASRVGREQARRRADGGGRNDGGRRYLH